MSNVAEIKTKETDSSVGAFIDSVKDEEQRKDSLVILRLMEQAAKEKPKMWGKSLVGFGKKLYKSPATGREVEWFRIGFSPRKANLSLHLLNVQKHGTLLKKLGKFKTGPGCLYIRKLADIDMRILEQLINDAARTA